MNNLNKEIKDLFVSNNIDWNSLNEARLGYKPVSGPIYFGVYSVIYKPGCINAEGNYLKKLKNLISFLEGLQLKSTKTLKYFDKIKAFLTSVILIDFNSVKFKEDCRNALLKPLLQLTKILGSKKSEILIDQNQIKAINKFFYQLNPFNYFFTYLSHLFYISDKEIKTILIDDSKRKSIREIDNIFQLTSYISRLEIPRRKNKTTLSFKYLILESNPGFNVNESIVYCGCSFDTNAGSGVREGWIIDDAGKWKHNETFNHWRR